MSLNRARGGDNMTTEEFDAIEASNAEAQLLDGSDVITEVSDPTINVLEAVKLPQAFWCSR